MPSLIIAIAAVGCSGPVDVTLGLPFIDADRLLVWRDRLERSSGIGFRPDIR